MKLKLKDLAEIVQKHIEDGKGDVDVEVWVYTHNKIVGGDLHNAQMTTYEEESETVFELWSAPN